MIGCGRDEKGVLQGKFISFLFFFFYFFFLECVVNCIIRLIYSLKFGFH